MTNIIGYFREEINEQNVQSQLEQLKAAGANKIYQEKYSDKKRHVLQLSKLLAEIKEGDIVVVASLDRIAQNTRHLLEIVETLNAIGVSFKVINTGIDTSTSHGEVMHMLLSSIVEFERQIVKERQSQGIARAKKEGRYKGRKPTAREKTDNVMDLNEQGLTRQKIADELGIGVASVYRILKAQAVSKKKLNKIAKKPEKSPTKKKRTEHKPVDEAIVEQLSFF